MKIQIAVVLYVLMSAIGLSIPVAMAVGKYQVCRNYFPELNLYACLFTNLPALAKTK